MNARGVALQVARDAFGPEQRGAQASFDVRARNATLDERDRAFAAELAYGSIKGRRLLDWYLAPYLASRAKAVPPVIEEILRLGIYQLRCMHGVDDYAAVFETVNLALRHGHRGTAGLVNAVLRRFLADAPAAPQAAAFASRADYLGTAYSVPTWIAAQWSSFPAGRCEAALAGINAAPQHAVRVNLLRSDVERVRAEFERAGAEVRRSPYVAEALVVAGAAIGDDAAGRWSVQSESACMPVDLLAPRSGETVLELCSGRGNKTVQIAARMRTEGSQFAVEIDPRKIRALEATLERSGAAGVAVVQGDASDAAAGVAADAVIVDAPCSGLGILGRHPEARWRKRPEDGARLALLQTRLMHAAGARTAAGGRLVYSVCSTDPREGREVIEAFLAAEPAFTRGQLPERYAEFAVDGDVLVTPGVEGRDGFYIALLSKAG